MINPEQFIAEEESKPVYYHIYSYYDKMLKRYNQPYVTTDEPGLVIEGAKASALKDPQASIKLKGLVLTYLGKFDIKTGKFEIFDECYGLVDLDRILVKEEVPADA